jgi:glutathione S-transferase
MTTPRLWSWMLSPFAGKVRVAAAEKGVELELLEIDPRNRPKRLRELNPTNRVPVLEVDGIAIRESTAICEWLEDTSPTHLLWPTDPAERAAARGILRWVDDELSVNFFLSMRKEAFGVEATDHPEVITHLRGNLGRRWSVLDDLLGRTDGPWLMGGDDPTLPDLAATPLAVRLPQWKPELQPSAEEQPRATAWLEALRSRPAAAEVDRAGEPVPADV